MAVIYEGETNTHKRLVVEQKENGVIHGQLTDARGDISATICHEWRDLWGWVADRGITDITWSDGKRGMIYRKRKLS